MRFPADKVNVVVTVLAAIFSVMREVEMHSAGKVAEVVLPVLCAFTPATFD